MHNTAEASGPKPAEKKRVISGIMMRHLPRGLVGVLLIVDKSLCFLECVVLGWVVLSPV